MKILVPVDGSPASAHAVKLAIDQVKAAAGASLVLVNVQNRATAGVAEATGLMPSGWIEQEDAVSKDLFREFSKTLAKQFATAGLHGVEKDFVERCIKLLRLKNYRARTND